MPEPSNQRPETSGLRALLIALVRRLVIGRGNVIRDRAYTNWNTLDVEAIVAEKEREIR